MPIEKNNGGLNVFQRRSGIKSNRLQPQQLAVNRLLFGGAFLGSHCLRCQCKIEQSFPERDRRAYKSLCDIHGRQIGYVFPKYFGSRKNAVLSIMRLVLLGFIEDSITLVTLGQSEKCLQYVELLGFDYDENEHKPVVIEDYNEIALTYFSGGTIEYPSEVNYTHHTVLTQIFYLMY